MENNPSIHSQNVIYRLLDSSICLHNPSIHSQNLLINLSTAWFIHLFVYLFKIFLINLRIHSPYHPHLPDNSTKNIPLFIAKTYRLIAWFIHLIIYLFIKYTHSEFENPVTFPTRSRKTHFSHSQNILINLLIACHSFIDIHIYSRYSELCIY